MENQRDKRSMVDRMKFVTSVRGSDFYEASPTFDEERRPKESIFSRLTDSLMDLIFEEVDERPIGMSQLSRKTFTSADPDQPGVFFKNTPTFSDYRFLRPALSPVEGGEDYGRIRGRAGRY